MSTQKCMHGMTKARGCSHLRLGNFCKMFKLPSWAHRCDIKEQCEAENIAATLGGPGGLMHDADGSSADSRIPAAYTFFAQFIDHDITLDTTTKLHGEELPDAEVGELPNLRSPSLDLDCVYGFGPDANPFLYDQSQPGRMLLGEDGLDVPRNSDGRALIGDPRNDENIFVSQLQLLFLKLHNRRIVGRDFEEAQQDSRYHYQWLVWYDFLRRVCDKDVYDFVQDQVHEKKYPLCEITDKHGKICMPVEFSVAAYRFGHTLVRSQYPANADFPVIDLFDERFGTEGFGPVPEELVVDWRFLLDVEPCHDYVNSKKIDHLLPDELIRMPDPIVGRFASDNDRSLAFRNLLRSYVLGLPSGQDVAAELAKKKYPIDPKQNLKFPHIRGWKCLEKGLGTKLEKHTPLFLYLMREADVVNNGERLGPVGSAILLEVFGAMLLHCESVLHPASGKPWAPDPCIWRQTKKPGQDPKTGFTLADVVRYVEGR